MNFLGIALFFCLAYPATSQVRHGSVGIIYFTPDKIVMAADSRVGLTAGVGVVAAPTDDGCKVAAVDGRLIFVSTGILSGPAGSSGWDNNSMIRAAYSDVMSGRPGSAAHIAEIAKKWSDDVAAKFNSLRPDTFQRLARYIGAEAFTVAYAGGLNEAGNLVLFSMEIAPNTLRTAAVGRVTRVGCVNSFCAAGSGVDVATEFVNNSSERARQEASRWRRPQGTLPSDYAAFKTMRIVELVLQYHHGNDIGGPIDAVQLSKSGLIRWYARKSNCQEN